MLALRKQEKVINKIVTIEIPEIFGDEVEVIILSNADEKKWIVLERIGNSFNGVCASIG